MHGNNNDNIRAKFVVDRYRPREGRMKRRRLDFIRKGETEE